MSRFAPLALIFALAAPAAGLACTVPQNADALRNYMANEINAARKARGLPALKPSGKLTKVAQNHACDMERQGTFTHVGSDGSDLARRLQRGGYRYRSANENVAHTRSAESAANFWQHSPGHLHNMLSPKIKEVGYGVALGPDKRQFWVMVGAR